MSEAAWPAVLSWDVWGRLLGGLESACQRTVVPSPLVAYCLRLAHAPPEVAAAAASVLRPLLAALEARAEEESSGGDESSDDEEAWAEEVRLPPCGLCFPPDLDGIKLHTPS